MRSDKPIAGFTFRAAIAALFLFAFVSCGGGGAGGSPSDKGPIVPVGELRSDLKFGYWAGDPLYMLEQCGHVNLWWARADTAPVWHLAIAAQLQAARGCGIKNIVLHLRDEDPAELRFQLGKLADGGYLADWDSITVYKWDEPDTSAGGNLSDQELSDRVLRVRQVMFDVPGMPRGTKVGIFYQCASGASPGARSFDFIGCFRYEGSGCAKLESDYARLRPRLKIGGRLWVIPGGAHINGKEGRQDPACWASYANRFADVWAVIGFMFQSGADPNNDIVGIRDMPDMLRLYCETGRAILKPAEQPRC